MTVELTVQQAQRLLLPVGAVAIDSIVRVESINDVFKVVTRGHGIFFVKFHTARWYSDQPDTFFVVNRECAVPELLRKRGLALPYRAWGEFTRGVVGRSVFVCEALEGAAVPDAVREYPNEAGEILFAFGRYMRRLHDIEFSLPGLIEPAHAYFADGVGRIPPVAAWPFSSDPAGEDQASALKQVASARDQGAITEAVAGALMHLFSSMGERLRGGYVPPRFTVGNCHAHHFHMARSESGWRVLGFYDFEGCRAGNPLMDLVGVEDTLV